MMPLDLEKLRAAISEMRECGSLAEADVVEALAERAQRYESALREIADSGGRTYYAACIVAAEALKR